MGQEREQTWFFLIEQTGPPEGGPVRVSPPCSCPHFCPHPSRPRADRHFVFRFSVPDHCITSQPFCENHAVSSTHVVPSSTLPPAGCLPARPAFACYAPSGFAAGASRHPHDPDSPVPRLSSLSLSHSFSPSGMERGMLALSRLRRSWRSRHRPGRPSLSSDSGMIRRRDSVRLTAFPWSLCGQRLRR